MRKTSGSKRISAKAAISDSDILEAMKEIPGYLDITPGDFRELYEVAYSHALDRFAESVTAASIMTRKVVSAKKDTPLAEVVELMTSKSVSGVPVLDKDNKVAGIISETDFLLHIGGKSAKSMLGIVANCLQGNCKVTASMRAKKAGDIMSSPAVTVSRDTTLQEITALMEKRKINRVPVVNDKGIIEGIVSRGDVVKASMMGGRD